MRLGRIDVVYQRHEDGSAEVLRGRWRFGANLDNLRGARPAPYLEATLVARVYVPWRQTISVGTA